MPPPLAGCHPPCEEPFFGGTLEIAHLWGVTAGARTQEQGQEETRAQPVQPEREEEGRALQKSGLQREMGEVCLKYVRFITAAEGGGDVSWHCCRGL